jgi:hypothetical protein
MPNTGKTSSGKRFWPRRHASTETHATAIHDPQYAEANNRWDRVFNEVWTRNATPEEDSRPSTASSAIFDPESSFCLEDLPFKASDTKSSPMAEENAQGESPTATASLLPPTTRVASAPTYQLSPQDPNRRVTPIRTRSDSVLQKRSPEDIFGAFIPKGAEELYKRSPWDLDEDIGSIMTVGSRDMSISPSTPSGSKRKLSSAGSVARSLVRTFSATSFTSSLASALSRTTSAGDGPTSFSGEVPHSN